MHQTASSGSLSKTMFVRVTALASTSTIDEPTLPTDSVALLLTDGKSPTDKHFFIMQHSASGYLHMQENIETFYHMQMFVTA